MNTGEDDAPTAKKKAGKKKTFDPSAFYKEVMVPKTLGDQFLDELLTRIRGVPDPPRMIFDLLSDLNHRRRRDEWARLREMGFDIRIYRELCQMLGAPDTGDVSWASVGGGDTAEHFLSVASRQTPDERKDLEAWIKAQKHLPILLLAGRFRGRPDVVDRLLRGWILKIDSGLRSQKGEMQKWSTDVMLWLEAFLRTKRAPKTVREHLAPVAFSYAQGGEQRRSAGLLMQEMEEFERRLEEAGREKASLEAEKQEQLDTVRELENKLAGSGEEVKRLKDRLAAASSLSDSGTRNALGDYRERLQRAILPDLEKIQLYLDREEPNTERSLLLLRRVEDALRG